MCLAIPGQIKSIEGREAEVEYGKSVRKAMIGEEKVKVGDWVMVQMGIVTEVIDEKEAKLRLKAWSEAIAGN